MKIPRHTVDLERFQRVFDLHRARQQSFVQSARENPDRPNLLGLLSSAISGSHRAGGLIDPTSPDVLKAIEVDAQASTGLFVFARIENPPRHIYLGDGSPVTFTKPVDESYVNVGNWMEAFRLSIISRQPELLLELAKVTLNQLRQSSTRGSPETYLQFEFHRAFLTEGAFSRHPAFAEYAEYCAKCQGRSGQPKAVRLLAVPYLEVLRQLDRGDEAIFNNALAEALTSHKKYWGSTEKLRNDINGLVSLRLTAVAALAHDRGIEVKVESDYIPASWVRGDHFERSLPSK